jgi:hypothetical protein
MKYLPSTERVERNRRSKLSPSPCLRQKRTFVAAS